MDNAPPPNFHPRGHLGLEQMRHIIEKQRESVIYRRLISRVEHLPTEAEIAAADSYYKVEAEGNLEAQISKLQETLGKLKAGTLAPPPAAPEPLPVAPAPAEPGERVHPPDGPDADERQAARARLLQSAERPPGETVTRTEPGAPPEPSKTAVITPEVKPHTPEPPPAAPEPKADRAAKGK
jgi:hypothetical protein